MLFRSNWNQKLNNKSTVFILGDSVLGAGEKSTQVFESLLYTLNFSTAYIMAGNHAAGYKTLFEKYFGNGIDAFYRLTFRIGEKTIHFIPNYYEIFAGRQPIVLSHYSILSWRDQSKGSWMIFGHSHDSLKQKEWIKNNHLIGKTMDVGFEAVHTPISFNELKNIMDAKPVTSNDHHTPETNPSF